jgi:hypothetical protein
MVQEVDDNGTDMSTFDSITNAAKPHASTLFNIRIRDFLGPEYAPMFDDILRMLCIQLTIQIMLYFSGSIGDGAFISREFLLLLTYIELGVLLYWLVVKKLVSFN